MACNPRCEYLQDYKICPEQQRHFICNTSLYRWCGTYRAIDRKAKDREVFKKTVESLVESAK